MSMKILSAIKLMCHLLHFIYRHTGLFLIGVILVCLSHCSHWCISPFDLLLDLADEPRLRPMRLWLWRGLRWRGGVHLGAAAVQQRAHPLGTHVQDGVGVAYLFQVPGERGHVTLWEPPFIPVRHLTRRHASEPLPRGMNPLYKRRGGPKLSTSQSYCDITHTNRQPASLYLFPA